jgi:anti-sigma regulatory factor (Ser/Thr protein kinase)
VDERGYVIAVGRYRREPRSVALARRNAIQAYTAYPWIDCSLVALLVSEVVTNSVLHADGSHFYVLCHSPSPLDGSLQVEVHDCSDTVPERRQATDQDEGGRGLALLDLLAAGWRTERTVTGKTLVFTLEGDKCRA